MCPLEKAFEEQRTLGAKIKELAEKANDDGHSWSAEDEQEWTRTNEAYNEKQAEVQAAKESRDKADRATAIAEQLEANPHKRPKVAAPDKRGGGGIDHRTLQARAIQGWMREANDLDATDEQRDAADQIGMRINGKGIDISLSEQRHVNGPPMWVCNDGASLTRESRAQSVGTDSAGGYLVSDGFVPELERRMLAFNGPRQVARVIRTNSGNQIEMPSLDDTGNDGADIAENAAVSEEALTFGTFTLNAYKHTSGALLIPQELLEDNEINLESEITDILGERLGRRTAAKYTTGTGSSQAQGIVTGASAGVTAAATAAIAADEIKDLIHSLDPSYRGMGSTGFMMHDSVLLAVRKLKDGDNRYLWQDSIQLGTPDRLEGYPVTINQNMESTIAATNITMLFGAFEKFIIRDVRGIRLYRLDELYRANDQTGFMAFIRTDSGVRQANAIKKLTQAAS